MTCEAECVRPCGRWNNSFMVQGVVIDVIQEINPMRQKQGITKIITDYKFGGGHTKQAAVVISSVKISLLGEQLNTINNPMLPLVATNINSAPDAAAAGKAKNNFAPVSAAKMWGYQGHCRECERRTTMLIMHQRSCY